MIPYKANAHIHSLNGEIKEVTVIDVDTSKPQTTYFVT